MSSDDEFDDVDALFESIDVVDDSDIDDFDSRHGSATGDVVLAQLGMTPSWTYLDYLPPDELKFAQLVAAGTNMTAAYAEAFDTTGMERNKISVTARRLAKRGRVATFITKTRSDMATAAQIDIGTLVGMVMNAANMAEEQQSPKDLLASVDRLSGLLGIGKNQEKEKKNTFTIELDDETRERMLTQITNARHGDDDLIDITPTTDVPQ